MNIPNFCLILLNLKTFCEIVTPLLISMSLAKCRKLQNVEHAVLHNYYYTMRDALAELTIYKHSSYHFNQKQRSQYINLYIVKHVSV